MAIRPLLGRDVEVLPSIYAADFLCLGEQVDALLAAGCRSFHFDVGDGHFVRPVTIGPVVLRAIETLVHGAGGVLDCHLMVDNPLDQLEEIVASGADAVSFHYEATDASRQVADAIRSYGIAVGLAFNPATPVAEAARAAIDSGVDFVLCMSIVPGYSGKPFMSEALDRIHELRLLLPAEVPIEVDGGIGIGNIAAVRAAGASLLVGGNSIFGNPDPAGAWLELASACATPTSLPA